jgi:hypothetical protein
MACKLFSAALKSYSGDFIDQGDTPPPHARSPCAHAAIIHPSSPYDESLGRYSPAGLSYSDAKVQAWELLTNPVDVKVIGAQTDQTLKAALSRAAA